MTPFCAHRTRVPGGTRQGGRLARRGQSPSLSSTTGAAIIDGQRAAEKTMDEFYDVAYRLAIATTFPALLGVHQMPSADCSNPGRPEDPR